ncbi:hypothetical protein [Paenibacillus konkukensis]|nr:hypothetical protein [Paenibacillus konkukensis]
MEDQMDAAADFFTTLLENHHAMTEARRLATEALPRDFALPLLKASSNVLAIVNADSCGFLT